MRASLLVSMLVLAGVPAESAFAQSGSGYSIMQDDYSIMVPEKGSRPSKPSKPEPWLAPKYKSPRGTVKHVVIPRSTTVPQPYAVTPPPIIVPQTGRALPNLPTISGSGRGGAETFQDRAARCAHQAGVYGPDAGNRNAYVGTCINQ
ncbi:MAG TPA: hypothetical protein VFL53_04820 [Pseudolabrys sp.]|nr:hypothetical protein [Pseudolabrys sp.]